MLEMPKTCLVLVDVQEKLIRVMHEQDECRRNLVILAQAAKLLCLPIVHCEQYPKALGPTIAELRKHLKPTRPIEKTCFSCMGSPEFSAALQQTGCTNVLLAGLEAHICVYQTALDMLSKGVNVHLVTDAISSRRLSNKEVAKSRMQQAGVCLTSTEMALFELLGSADHPHFKHISKLIR